MLELIVKASSYGVFEALPVSAAAAAVYLVIRVILLKKRMIGRKPFLSEAAGVLLAGYIAGLLMIVWFSRRTSWGEFVYKISHYGDLWRDGYHYTNNKRVLRLFSAELAGYERFEVAANTVLFVPFGFLLPAFWEKLKWWQTDLICLGATCVIELIQPLIDGVGDVDDVIANAFGGIVGCLLCKTVIAIVKYVKKHKKSRSDT